MQVGPLVIFEAGFQNIVEFKKVAGSCGPKLAKIIFEGCGKGADFFPGEGNLLWVELEMSFQISEGLGGPVFAELGSGILGCAILQTFFFAHEMPEAIPA